MIAVLDITGSFFSLLSTYCYVMSKELCWPLGIVATILNALLYGLTGIYGDMGLEIIYFGSMFYGWYQWRYGGEDHSQRVIQHLSIRLVWILGGIAILASGLLFYWLKCYWNSQVPIMDAVTTTLSLIAQWLTCIRILECWIVWFVVDAIYVGLYFNKDLPIHSLLLIVYLVMAIMGYWRWSMLNNSATSDRDGSLI